MKPYAYIRVSTTHQDVNTQNLAILNFAHKENIVVDHFVETVISLRRSTQKEQLTELIGQMLKGDCLIVSELSRLGRSLSQIINSSYAVLRHIVSIPLDKLLPVVVDGSEVRNFSYQYSGYLD